MSKRYLSSGDGYWYNAEDPSEGCIGIPSEVEKSMQQEWEVKFFHNEDLTGLEKVVLKKPRKKRKGSKTGISVRLAPRDAKKVYDNFNFSKESLKSLIEEYVPQNTRKSVDSMEYRELRHYGHVIFGVAKKELRKSNKLYNQ